MFYFQVLLLMFRCLQTFEFLSVWTAVPERIWKFESRGREVDTRPAQSTEKHFWSCPSTFLALQVQLVVLVSAFVTVITVCSVSCSLFFYSRCPLCPAICNSEGSVPPCPMESAPMSVNVIQKCNHLTINVIQYINYCTMQFHSEKPQRESDIRKVHFVHLPWRCSAIKHRKARRDSEDKQTIQHARLYEVTWALQWRNQKQEVTKVRVRLKFPNLTKCKVGRSVHAICIL